MQVREITKIVDCLLNVKLNGRTMTPTCLESFYLEKSSQKRNP